VRGGRTVCVDALIELGRFVAPRAILHQSRVRKLALEVDVG
jgi:hypothetical protein